MQRMTCWRGFASVAMVIFFMSGCSRAPIADQKKIVNSNVKNPNSSTPSVTTGSQEKPAVNSTATAASSDSKASHEEPVVEDLSKLTRKQLRTMIQETQQAGMQSIFGKKGDDGYRIFVESGRCAAHLQKEYPELSSAERTLCANAFYNQACGLSMLDDAAGALEAMKRAIEAGYDDFDNLDRDTDLVKLRQLTEYASVREDWEKSAAERRKAVIAQELAEFESYPFDFTLPDLDDISVKLADFSGKVVIVDIWGTWCPPCRAEIPSFVKLQSKYSDQGLQIIGLNYEQKDDSEAAIKGIRKFMESNKMNYPCLIGDSKTQSQVPSFRGYPTTLFLDRTGKVRMQFVGAHPYGKLESVVLALLAESSQ